VLSAIADYPGASNREVAERAGVVDQGQISKLLARLEARGLIAKIGEGRTRGAPNAWRLTERGESLMSSTSVRGVMRLPRDPDVL
jgi:DNA-binding MarR family transcriptional regulator